ncbi:MAG: hypothetical protein ACJAW3_000891 [Lentimonas sp.]|jgi:hypothetical protein
MKKTLIIFISYFFMQNNAFAVNTENGVWKSLGDQYDQIIDNEKVLTGRISNKIYFTDVFESNLRKDHNRETYLKSKLDLNLRLNKYFSVNSAFKFDKMTQNSEKIRRNSAVKSGGDMSFENEGIYLKELVLNFNYKNFSALAGKFTANFGSGWSSDNGIWVNELSKRYKQDEKLGFGAIQRFGNKKKNGEYVFGLSAFTNDRKNLDNSIITKRDETSKADGEAGDTRGLKSYNISADIFYDFEGGEELSYHFAYLNLAINDRRNVSNISSKIDDEKSFVAGMKYKYPINNNVLLNSFVEYVQTDNSGGNIDVDSKILTFNFTTYFYEKYFLILARAIEKEMENGGNGINREINEIAIGYKFNDSILKGLSISMGYNNRQEDKKTSVVKNQSLGFLVAHKIEF